jgi:hypothetical protein
MQLLSILMFNVAGKIVSHVDMNPINLWICSPHLSGF